MRAAALPVTLGLLCAAVTGQCPATSLLTLDRGSPPVATQGVVGRPWSPIAAVSLPQAGADTAFLAFRVESLPAGLALNVSSGEISGVPLFPTEGFTLRVLADVNGSDGVETLSTAAVELVVRECSDSDTCNGGTCVDSSDVPDDFDMQFYCDCSGTNSMRSGHRCERPSLDGAVSAPAGPVARTNALVNFAVNFISGTVGPQPRIRVVSDEPISMEDLVFDAPELPFGIRIDPETAFIHGSPVATVDDRTVNIRVRWKGICDTSVNPWVDVINGSVNFKVVECRGDRTCHGGACIDTSIPATSSDMTFRCDCSTTAPLRSGARCELLSLKGAISDVAARPLNSFALDEEISPIEREFLRSSETFRLDDLLFDAPDLPAGLRIDPFTGTITGTPLEVLKVVPPEVRTVVRRRGSEDPRANPWEEVVNGSVVFDIRECDGATTCNGGVCVDTTVGGPDVFDGTFACDCSGTSPPLSGARCELPSVRGVIAASGVVSVDGAIGSRLDPQRLTFQSSHADIARDDVEFDAPGLPFGLVIDRSTGTVSGTPLVGFVNATVPIKVRRSGNLDPRSNPWENVVNGTLAVDVQECRDASTCHGGTCEDVGLDLYDGKFRCNCEVVAAFGDSCQHRFALRGADGASFQTPILRGVVGDQLRLSYNFTASASLVDGANKSTEGNFTFHAQQSPRGMTALPDGLQLEAGLAANVLALTGKLLQPVGPSREVLIEMRRPGRAEVFALLPILIDVAECNRGNSSAGACRNGGHCDGGDDLFDGDFSCDCEGTGFEGRLCETARRTFSVVWPADHFRTLEMTKNQPLFHPGPNLDAVVVTPADTPFHYTATGLPCGVEIDPSSGDLKGTPGVVLGNNTVLVYANAVSGAGSTLAATKQGATVKACGNGTCGNGTCVLVDDDEFNEDFSCDCSHAGRTGDRCDETLLAPIIGGVVGGLLFTALLALLLWKMHDRHERNKRLDFATALLQLHKNGLVSDATPGGSGPREIKRKYITVQQQIGHGEFGIVQRAYLSEPNALGFTVAAKSLLDDEKMDDFTGEAALMSDLHHANVLSLVGVCTEGLPKLMVMEMCGKGDLKRFLENMPNALNLAVLLGFCNDIIDGMAYLAARRLVHRDLAARNCLVADDFTCKVSDFGMARQLASSKTYCKVASRKLPLRWTPVEAIEEGKFTEKSDVWSFGVLCSEVFSSGGKPYPSLESNQAVLRYIKGGKRLSRPPLCPGQVYSHLLLPCWEERPDDRPTFTQLQGVMVLVLNYHKNHREVLKDLTAAEVIADECLHMPAGAGNAYVGLIGSKGHVLQPRDSVGSDCDIPLSTVPVPRAAHTPRKPDPHATKPLPEPPQEVTPARRSTEAAWAPGGPDPHTTKPLPALPEEVATGRRSTEESWVPSRSGLPAVRDSLVSLVSVDSVFLADDTAPFPWGDANLESSPHRRSEMWLRNGSIQDSFV